MAKIRTKLPTNYKPIEDRLLKAAQVRKQLTMAETNALLEHGSRVHLDIESYYQAPAWFKPWRLFDEPPAETMKLIDEAVEHGNMTRKIFEDLALACRQIEAALDDASFVEGERGREEVMELVVARLAYVCANHNKHFDSFKFNAAARGRKP